MSVASARVGRGVLTIVSTTRVKMMGLPTRLQAYTYARACMLAHGVSSALVNIRVRQRVRKSARVGTCASTCTP